MMKTFATTTALAAGLLALTACGGRGDDTLGDNVEQAYDNRADALEARADNLEAQAEALRDEGDRKEAAIDASDVNATALNAQQQSDFANRQ